MISVLPLTQKSYVAAQKATIIRTVALAAVAFTAIAVAAASLTDFTGDMLSALLLVLTGAATMAAMFAPRSQARHGHG